MRLRRRPPPDAALRLRRRTTRPASTPRVATSPTTSRASFVEASLVKALFPVDSVRRGFLKAVGANTARAAIASVLPIGALQAMAQDKGPLEKKDLKIGFIAITCASAADHGRPPGLLQEGRPERPVDEDGGLGADPRQDDQQGARRFALPVADAAGHDHGPGLQPGER
jgi:hypothetical protein